MQANTKKRLVHRLKIVQGQVAGLLKMVQDEDYCIDIITQSSAIKEALSSAEDLILENHLQTHVLHQMKHGKEKQAIEEILSVYKLAQRKK